MTRSFAKFGNRLLVPSASALPIVGGAAGAVWLDAQSYLVRGLELEWLDGDKPMRSGAH